MIRIGIELKTDCINSLALSNEFNPIDKKTSFAWNIQEIESWINSLKTHSDEMVKCYADRFQFQRTIIPCYFFNLNEGPSAFYLVNHRRITNMIQLFQNYSLFNFRKTTPANIPFLLASAELLFPRRFIQQHCLDVSTT